MLYNGYARIFPFNPFLKLLCTEKEYQFPDYHTENILMQGFVRIAIAMSHRPINAYQLYGRVQMGLFDSESAIFCLHGCSLK